MVRIKLVETSEINKQTCFTLHFHSKTVSFGNSIPPASNMLFSIANKASRSRHHKSKSHPSSSRKSRSNKSHKQCDQLGLDDGHYRATEQAKKSKKKHRSTSIHQTKSKNHSMTTPISSNQSQQHLKQQYQSQTQSKYDYEGQTQGNNIKMNIKPTDNGNHHHSKHSKHAKHSKSKSTPNPLRATSHSISKDDEKAITISPPLLVTSPRYNDDNNKFDVKHETEHNHSVLVSLARSQNVAKQDKIDALIKFVTTTTTRQRIEIIKYLKSRYNGFDLEEYIEKLRICRFCKIS